MFVHWVNFQASSCKVQKAGEELWNLSLIS